MPILNRAAEMQDEIAGWRHELHQMPEILYEVHQTAAFVAERLRSFGCDEVVTGIGRTGVVAVIKGARGPGSTIGLRADMDALPLQEITGKPYASRIPGRMHACGHDGHTAMLLGAAKYLAETRNFSGTAVLIFQPAEEGGAGGKAMLDDGLVERFGIEAVYGMHNMPGLPAGTFAIRPGPIMAATAEFDVKLVGRGGHAAMPHTTIDPVVAASQLVLALQTIASRNTDPIDSVVVSVTKIHAGEAHNVIAQFASLGGTIRTLRKEVAADTYRRFREICDGVAATFGVAAEVEIDVNYPVTYNHATQTDFAAAVAAEIVGEAHVDTATQPVMGGEDFSYMLEARPGAFIFLGNGASAGLHNPAYDFNDEIIPQGVSYWVQLVERALPA